MPHVDDGRLNEYLDHLERPAAWPDSGMAARRQGSREAWRDGGAADERPSGTEPSRREIERHLAECVACRERLDEVRALRDRAATILRSADPVAGAAPPFEEVRSRAARGRGARPAWRLSRLAALGWAATIVVAVGAGWIMRGELGRRGGVGSGSMTVEGAAGARTAAGAPAPPESSALASVDRSDSVPAAGIASAPADSLTRSRETRDARAPAPEQYRERGEAGAVALRGGRATEDTAPAVRQGQERTQDRPRVDAEPVADTPSAAGRAPRMAPTPTVRPAGDVRLQEVVVTAALAPAEPIVVRDEMVVNRLAEEEQKAAAPAAAPAPAAAAERDRQRLERDSAVRARRAGADTAERPAAAVRPAQEPEEAGRALARARRDSPVRDRDATSVVVGGVTLADSASRAGFAARFAELATNADWIQSDRRAAEAFTGSPLATIEGTELTSVETTVISGRPAVRTRQRRPGAPPWVELVQWWNDSIPTERGYALLLRAPVRADSLVTLLTRIR